MKRNVSLFAIAVFVATYAEGAAELHCSRLTSVRFERATPDTDVTLLVYYDGEIADLPPNGRPSEYLICSGYFTLVSDDGSKKVNLPIVTDRYRVDRFGTIHVVVRAKDLDR